jgi:toxin ParE1/3/4
MPRIALLPEVAEDFDRILAHLFEHQASEPEARISEILAAIAVLEHSPSIGRLAKRGMRELVVGQETHGYLVLYRHDAVLDTVFVLAVGSQREAGYAGE